MEPKSSAQQSAQDDLSKTFAAAPSLSAVEMLEQYQMNSNSFQREMEALGAYNLPSPKDGTWQVNASKLLNSPTGSPRRATPSPLGNDSYAFTVSGSQPLQHPQPPAQPTHSHQPPLYSNLQTVTGANPGFNGPYHAAPTWGPPTDFMTSQPHRTLDTSVDGIADIAWSGQLEASGTSMVGNCTQTVVTVMPGTAATRQSFDGVSVITARLGSSTLDSGGLYVLNETRSSVDESGRGHVMRQVPPPDQQVAQLPVHEAVHQPHYVTTGVLDDSGCAGRVGSAAVAMPTVPVPPAAYGGPASAPQAAAFQKRQRSVRSQLTFEAYENQYGPAAKCDSGPCADHCISPCKAHTCKCCKKHRKMEVAGARSKGGYCGKCNRREKVEGLEFVKCNHTCMGDGISFTCGVEMLRDVFDNHWKQHKNEPHVETLPMLLDVETDEGRKCGACTNMRPVSYYPNKDTNCSCNHCQVVKSKSSGSSRTSESRRLSNPGSSLLFSMHSAQEGQRRHSFAGTGPNTPRSEPRSGPSFTGQFTGSDNNNQTDTSPQMSMQNATPPNLEWSHMTLGGIDSLPSPGTAQLIKAGLLSNDPVAMSGWGTSTPQANTQTDYMAQQAETMLSSALASVMSARPSLDILLTRCQQLRYQPGQEQQAAQAAVQRIVQAGRKVERELQQLLVQANALATGPQ